MGNNPVYYVDKRMLGKVNRVEADGNLSTYNGDIPVFKGQIIFATAIGEHVVMNEDYYKEFYVPVKQVKEKKKMNAFEELYAQQIAEFNGTLKQDESDLHIKNDELVSNKAL